MRRSILVLFGVALMTGGVAAAELPLIDAHVHYSHDAWDGLPPKEAVAILRKAGLRRVLVSSSSDEGTQKLVAEARRKLGAALRS